MRIHIDNTPYRLVGAYNPNEIGCDMCDLNYNTCCYLCADYDCEYLRKE